MIRMAMRPPAHVADEMLGRIERRPRPDKADRLRADTGLDRGALQKALGRPLAEAAPLRDARSFAARSLALDGLR